MRKFLCVCAEKDKQKSCLRLLPVKVRYKKAQSSVVGRRQLLEKVSDLEDDPVELDARAAFLSRRRALRFVSLLHNHSLALFGQADEFIVVSI